MPVRCVGLKPFQPNCFTELENSVKSAEPTQRAVIHLIVLLAGMPDSIPGSWLGMVLSCWSTVGENVSQGGSGLTNSGLRSSNSPLDSHLPASAGCKTPRDLCIVFRACSGGLDIHFHFTTLWWLKHGYVFHCMCWMSEEKVASRTPIFALD